MGAERGGVTGRSTSALTGSAAGREPIETMIEVA